MDSLYPNLHDRFKSEGLCPICLLEMELASRFTCSNGHTICHRCKPFYYSCPTCLEPLEMETPSSQSSSSYMSPSAHHMPHPLPPMYSDHHPSAPSMEEFLQHERNYYPPQPPAHHELRACSYADLGCWVKVPIYLVDLHESRCQFRPHLEEEHLPTDLAHLQDDLVECKYRVAGCKVRTMPWRASIHEKYCIYKDRCDPMNDITESLDHTSITDEYSEELVECKYRKYGCMVNMPRRRKLIHQEKCNYQKYKTEEDESSSENEYDPDEQVACKWAEHGCRVKPKRNRLEAHEEKCNYRMEECAFKDNGCTTLFHPSRKFAHERCCQYAD